MLCAGASHAFGGTEPAPTALTRVTAPGGRLLFGDGCWASPPSPAATAIFGETVPSLPQLLEADDPRAAEVRDWLDAHERQYVEVYRGILGFACLILAH